MIAIGELQTIFNVFNVIKIFVIATISLGLTLLLTPIWTKLLYKYFSAGKQIKTEDAPIFKKLHENKVGTPTMGGVLIWFTVFLLTLGFWILSSTIDGFWSNFNFLSRGQTLLPLGALVVAALLGMIDDVAGIFRIGPKGGGIKTSNRLFLYLLVAVGVSWWFYFKLDFNSINIPFLGDLFIGWWYIPISIFVIVATSFSANLTDGLDGLVGGTFLSMFAAFGAIAFVQGRIDLVVFIAAIMGSLVAFLWFNIYPAKFFMGDTGVMSLGVVMAIVAMLTDTILLLPIIAFIFVVESLSVIFQVASKKLRKKKIFLSAPIHHHFEAKGWHETRITMRFWIVSAVFALGGLIIFLVDSKTPPIWNLF